MTREEQINRATREWENSANQEYSPNPMSFQDGARWADENPKNPWISVNERLPKEGQHIVMYDSAYDGYRTIYYPEPYITDNMDYWMPIPELPKED